MFNGSTKLTTNHLSRHANGIPDEYPHSQGREESRSHNEEWLGTLAHELRSPLATILGALEVMADGPDIDPSARLARNIAERQARRAVQIVDDLFDACAGARGKLSLRRKDVDLVGIVAQATETAAHVLTKRRHKVTVSLPQKPVTVYADSLRLEQVLTNLLVNAAKFTDPGGDIRLTIEAEAGEVSVRVRDNGRGIHPDLLPVVFDLFQQGSDFTCHGTSGLGIGLALVKSLVELHGGRVTAYSDGPGTGSEFVVCLPASVPAS
ncbi:MAG TPA: HAMP domain-containing sensor histidine kinase [Gemmata sp.]|nr:HAMP domain-containing sensor histidine kinase [Gemmata sp.]